MYPVSFIYSNLSPHCFPFSSIQGKFFLSPRTMEFFTVTTVKGCIFHRNYQFPYHPRVWPLVWIAITIGNSIPSLRIFTIWRVKGWQRSMRRPPWMRMKNGPPFIIDTLVSRGRHARGGVPQIIWYIYAPPQNRPKSGDAKHILPLTGDAAALAGAHARVIPNWGVGVGVLYLERVHWNTGTVKSHRRRLCILHAEYTQHATPPKKDG